MAGEREPSFEVVIGFKGVGKTYLTNQIIEEYITNSPDGRRGRPVLVFDVNNEYCDSNGYYGFKAIDYDTKIKNEYERALEIRKIRVPGKYRILPFCKNGQPMSMSELMQCANTIVKHYRGGMLLLEDINKYTMYHFKQDFVGMFIGLRHLGVDLIAHFQSIRAIPTRVWANMNYLRWHKQGDKIIQYKSRISNFELYSIAECIVNQEYLKDQYYHLWIDVLHEKLINVTPEQFRSGCVEYLNSNQNMLYKEMKALDMEGKKRYGNVQDAQKGIVEAKMRMYLSEVA